MGDLQVSPLRRAGKGLSFDILGLIDRRHLGHVLFRFYSAVFLLWEV